MKQFNAIHSVGNREKIKFKCKACGACCKNVRDSVMLDAFDAFRLIKYFKKIYPNKSPDEILSLFSQIKELSPGYFIYILRTFGDEDACIFLKNNSCTVYKYRPRVCRIYPFTIDKVLNGNTLKWLVCTDQPHHFNGGYISPREWQKKMLTNEERDFFKTEISIIPQIGQLTRKIPTASIDKAAELSLGLTYFAYDFSLPFLPQYKDNMVILINLLNKMASDI